MASLANHVLGMHLKRTIAEVKQKKYVRTRTPKNGIADILPAEGENKQWFNAWSHIIYQVNQGNYTICDDWKYASKFKQWFDANHCPDGIVTQLFNPVLNPRHFSPETTCIVPKALSALVNRAGNYNRNGMRGVHFRQRAKSIAYSAMCWDLEKERALPKLAESELDAHLTWAVSHVARLRAFGATLTKETTKNLIERFCLVMEEDIKAGVPMRMFEGK